VVSSGLVRQLKKTLTKKEVIMTTAIVEAPGSLTVWAVQDHCKRRSEDFKKMSTAGQVLNCSFQILKNTHYVVLDIAYVPLTFFAKTIAIPYSLSSVLGVQKKFEEFAASTGSIAENKQIESVSKGVERCEKKLKAIEVKQDETLREVKKNSSLLQKQGEEMRKGFAKGDRTTPDADKKKMVAAQKKVEELQRKNKEDKKKRDVAQKKAEDLQRKNEELTRRSEELRRKCSQRKKDKTSQREEISKLKAEIAKAGDLSERTELENTKLKQRLSQIDIQQKKGLSQGLVAVAQMPQGGGHPQMFYGQQPQYYGGQMMMPPPQIMGERE
jgi:hypothetical protein